LVQLTTLIPVLNAFPRLCSVAALVVTPLASLLLLLAVAAIPQSRRAHQHDFTFPVSDPWTAYGIWCIDFYDAVALYRPSDDFLDAIHVDAAVDDAIIDHRVVGDVVGDAYQLHVTRRGGNDSMDTWGKHMAFLYEGKPARVNIHPDVRCAQANACLKAHSGR
jgi:hypothetical protein